MDVEFIVPPVHPSLPVPTEHHAEDYQVLRGLTGVQIVIENLNVHAISIGLTEGNVRAPVDRTLRRNTIPILSQQEKLNTRGFPKIYVAVNVLEKRFGYQVSVMELVRLERNPYFSTKGIIYKTDSVGYHANNPDFILQTLDSSIELFSNDYLKANPKE